MSFLDPLDVRLLNDRAKFPWMTLSERRYEDAVTGRTFTIPKYFRTDGASIPIAMAAIPVVGQAMVIRYFGSGVFLGFAEGVLHDYLRRGDNPPVPAHVAHRVFRAALYSAGYPSDLCEMYYAAVVAFNSNR